MAPLQKAFFLDVLLERKDQLTHNVMSELDTKYDLSNVANVEIALNWFLLCAELGYSDSYPAIKAFLGQHGRMKYNRPIYRYSRFSLKKTIII